MDNYDLWLNSNNDYCDFCNLTDEDPELEEELEDEDEEPEDEVELEEVRNISKV